jgi:hypothetical protein
MSSGYQISVSEEAAQQASTSPPFPPRSTLIRHEWDFDESEFPRMPELRRWIEAEGIEDAEEQGFAGEGGRLSPDDTLVNFSTTATARDIVRRAEFVDSHECPTCGLPDARLVEDPVVELEHEPRAGALLTYISELDAFALPASVIDELRAADLARGLATVSVDAPGERHLIVYSDVGVGEPVAPYGTTGERCPECGRAYRRTPDGATYPALPKYALYLLFEQPSGERQWVWSTIGGRLWPMVTHDVAEWLAERDPDITFVKRGWSADELDKAFLAEEYR